GLSACSTARNPSNHAGNDFSSATNDLSTVVTGDGSVVVTPFAFVYAHTDLMLYTVDPDTLAIAPISNFGWPSGSDTMTDIALDHSGNMIGISYGSIYSIDKTTAKCTFLSSFAGGSFNGLSFIANSSGSNEQLVGADLNGDLYAINPMTGMQTLIGNYGNGWTSSGDLVSVEGATYATVAGTEPTDVLVKVDTATGKATQIGITGYSSIWGLGYWKQKVFGFTESDGMVTIDVTTGKATPAPSQSGSISWYGAGVTTAAPVTIN
ncbi:MAG: hypothetical protein ABI321_15660, partial [Polyangia bacterium]